MKATKEELELVGNYEASDGVELSDGVGFTDDQIIDFAKQYHEKQVTLGLPSVSGSYPTANDIWGVARTDDVVVFQKWYNKHFGNYR